MNDTCVMCGAELPTESGKQYCNDCEEKANDKLATKDYT